MISKKTIIVLFPFISFFLQANYIQNQSSSSLAHFSAYSKAQTLQVDSLAIKFWRNYVYNLAGGGEYFFVKPNDKNKLVFSVTTVGQASKMIIEIHGAVSVALGDYTVEPGDSITIVFNRKDDEIFPTFYGRGSMKYRCVEAMKIKSLKWRSAIRKKGKELPELFQAYNANMLFEIFDQRNTEELQVLDKFKNKISPAAYKILKADTKAGIEQLKITYLLNYSRRAKNESDLRLAATLYKKYALKPDTNESEVLALSMKYVDYLFEYAKAELVEQTGLQASYAFSDLFSTIQNNFSGILQEKIISMALLEGSASLSKTDYDSTLPLYYTQMKNKFLREMVARELALYSQGSIPFNFVLPDTSGRIVRLSDFIGKVVFIHVWSTGCTGCVIFEKHFVEEVYPSLKNEKDFIVITISEDKNRLTWLNSIKGEKYTNGNYINVYTDGEGINHPFIKYYDIQAIPFFLLIGKDGRLYSKLSGNIPELRSRITEALGKE